jgi:hypothetical protein
LDIFGKGRPNILSLFNTWVKRRVIEDNDRRRSVYDIYDDDYEEEMETLRRYYGCVFSNSFDVDDDGETIFPLKNDGETTLRPGQYKKSADEMDEYWDKMSKFNSNGTKVKKKHRKRHKAKVIDINEPYNANYIDDDAPVYCTIYFYEDYHDKYSRIEFNNLFEFDQYCKENGFNVPAYVSEEVAYSPISHCCLNPLARERGELEIMRQETYGDLYYEACDTSELSN